jgi:type VI secretion system protein ImpM
MTPPVVPGLYGKLPVAGDFVTRRLPTQFVKTWDAWIQEALIVSREQLDAQWLDVYLTSPIWRFIVNPGNSGEKASAGILMPSVDKIGRYFPLTLAAMLDDRETLPYLFVAAADWFDDLERLALSALEDDFQLDALDQELQKLQLSLGRPTDGDQGAKKARGGKDGKIPVRIVMEKLAQIPEAFKELGVCLLTRSYSSYSLWSTEGSNLLNPSLLVYHGLPPPTDFSGFLTGDWSRFGVSQPIDVSPLFCPPAPSPAAAPGSEVDAKASSSIQWQSFGRSDVGQVRALNEDAFLDNPQSGVWAVADGMGGHLAGDEASQATIAGLTAITGGGTLETLTAFVTACLQHINSDLFRRAQKNNNGQIMGSTVVVMLAVGNQCAAIWAGDSRLYRYAGGHLSQLTRDHSPDAELADPSLTAPEIANTSNVVTRALGAEEELAVDIVTFEATPGDTYLLCSDGLVKELTPQEIGAILHRSDSERCAHALIDLALSRGARDNVTVVVVAADGKPEPASSPAADG